MMTMICCDDNVGCHGGEGDCCVGGSDEASQSASQRDSQPKLDNFKFIIIFAMCSNNLPHCSIATTVIIVFLLQACCCKVHRFP